MFATFQYHVKMPCSREVLKIFASDGARASRIPFSRDVGITSLSQLLVGIPHIMHTTSSGETDSVMPLPDCEGCISEIIK